MVFYKFIIWAKALNYKEFHSPSLKAGVTKYFFNRTLVLKY
jgi:hypothetical protein